MYVAQQGNHAQAAFRNFVYKTGMHAVPIIALEESRIHRAVWTFLLFLAFAFLTGQIFLLTVKFISRPTTTETSVHFESPTEFPAVTICNLNPISLLKLSRKKKGSYNKRSHHSSQRLFSKRTKRSGRPGTVSRSLISLRNIFNAPNPFSSGKISFRQSLRRLTSEFLKRQNVVFLMNKLKDTEFEEVSDHLEDMLISCSFLGQPCFTHDFLPIKNSRYGICYTFNSGTNRTGQSVPLRLVTSSGSLSGLELMLNVDQASYLPNIAASAGFKLLIHDHTEVPLPDVDGHLVGPGRYTAFGVRKSIVRRAKQPYGLCKEFTPAENQSLNMFLMDLPRTQPNMKVCIRTCEQLQILTHCRCYSLNHGFANAKAFDKILTKSRQRPCEVHPSTPDYNCTQSIINLIAAGNLSCKSSMCRFHECTSYRFVITQSSAAWPSDRAILAITRKVGRMMRMRTYGRKIRHFVEKNLLRVLVYFEDLAVTKIETMPAYTSTDYVSDIGGQGGLWLGISAFTILEVIVLVCRLSKIAICGAFEKKEKTEEIATHSPKKNKRWSIGDAFSSSLKTSSDKD